MTEEKIIEQAVEPVAPVIDKDHEEAIGFAEYKRNLQLVKEYKAKEEAMAAKQKELDEEMSKYDPFYNPFKELKKIDDDVVREKIAEKVKKLTKKVAENPALPVQEREEYIKDAISSEIEEYNDFNSRQKFEIEKKMHALSGFVDNSFGKIGSERVLKNAYHILTYGGIVTREFAASTFNRMSEKDALKLIQDAADLDPLYTTKKTETASDKINNKFSK
jgi:hypothetical protein